MPTCGAQRPSRPMQRLNIFDHLQYEADFQILSCRVQLYADIVHNEATDRAMHHLYQDISV